MGKRVLINLIMANEIQQVRQEGVKVGLVLRTAKLAFRGTKREWYIENPQFSNPLCGEESPIEAFKLFFPMYQVERFRGIDIIDRKLDFFRGYKISGLYIDANSQRIGTLRNLYKGDISLALRQVHRRNSAYLGREAELILKYLSGNMQGFSSASDDKMANHCREVARELSLAFDSLESEGKIMRGWYVEDIAKVEN